VLHEVRNFLIEIRAKNFSLPAIDSENARAIALSGKSPASAKLRIKYKLLKALNFYSSAKLRLLLLQSPM
jgi:hypothetical protein